MAPTPWMMGALALAASMLACSSGPDTEEIVAQLCTKWDQCFPEQDFGFCIFEEITAQCANEDEFGEHFATCLDMTCDVLAVSCLSSGMPQCEQSVGTTQPSLPWLPRRQEDDVSSPPLPGGAP